MTSRLAAQVRNERDRLDIAEIHDTIESYLAPFRPGRVGIYTHYDRDFLRHAVRVAISTFPNDAYLFERDRDALVYLTHEELVWAVAQGAAYYFARLREPVGENVQLGEN